MPTRTASPASSKPDVAAFTRDVVERVSERLDELITEIEAAGGSSDALGTPEAVAARMIGTIPQPSPWVSVLGAVYTTASLRPLLGGVTRQAIEDRIKRGTLFALMTADRRRVFPAYQFDDHFDTVPGFIELLSVLRDGGDDWTIASWLVSPHPALDNTAPVAWLRAAHPLGAALDVARATARRWAA